MTSHRSSPESICLLRLSALGDVCNCVATVRAIRRRWPNCRLTWIIGPAEHALVGDLPDIEFIVFDKQKTRLSLAQLRRSLAGRRFDILLLAQVSLRANLVSMLIKARRRIGFDRARSREGHSLFISERIPSVSGQHQALALHSFADHIGAPMDGVDRALPVPESARDFARTHQPEIGKAVLISPASSHVGRNWHPAGYAQVADWVAGHTGRPVILIGGPSPAERKLGEAITASMSMPVTNLIGQDTLKQALAMLERCACLVTPDAGPAHFAAAMGRPVVGLYAATWSKRSGPLGSLDHCVDCFPQAARQFLGKAPEQVRWGKRLEFPGVMELITPGMVIEKLRVLLG
ncbi:MAG: lipopolysaccharide heptosyltransferase family protein [Wenzhouxiangella sp.]|nr:MAG: lipopolysaccharide heptosyltransferase family protein [Wenzhouxiangella sp.]